MVLLPGPNDALAYETADGRFRVERLRVPSPTRPGMMRSVWQYTDQQGQRDVEVASLRLAKEWADAAVNGR